MTAMDINPKREFLLLSQELGSKHLEVCTLT